MKHTYKTRIYRVLVNAAMGLALAVIVSFIVGFFIPSNIVRALVFIAILAGYVWLVIINNIITIEVDDKTLTIKKVKKRTYMILRQQLSGLKSLPRHTDDLMPEAIRNVHCILRDREKRKCWLIANLSVFLILMSFWKT